jgi:hypothetical protein
MGTSGSHAAMTMTPATDVATQVACSVATALPFSYALSAKVYESAGWTPWV